MTRCLGKALTCLNAYRIVRSNSRLNHGSLKFVPHLQSQQSWPQIAHRPRSENYATSKGESRFLPKNESTIYALSTAPGRAAIAIIRISGPACMNVCDRPKNHDKEIISNRFTMGFAQENRPRSRDMRHFAHCTIHGHQLANPKSWIPMLWFCIFLAHKL